MRRLYSSTPPHESARHERAIEALAQQLCVPIDHVAQLYERELAALTVSARITGFLSILTTRKVREILRQRRHPARTSELDFIHFGYEALSINTLGSDPVPEVFECRVKYPTFKNVSH